LWACSGNNGFDNGLQLHNVYTLERFSKHNGFSYADKQELAIPDSHAWSYV